MELQEFIDFYSEAYRSFGLFSDSILRSNAEYLEGYAHGRGDGNEKLLEISKNLRDVAHVLSVLKQKAQPII